MTDDPILDGLQSSLIQPGWEVYSSDGERVGTVDAVEADRFSLELEILGGSSLAVPFDAIEAADDGRIELDVPAEMIGQMGWKAEDPSS